MRALMLTTAATLGAAAGHAPGATAAPAVPLPEAARLALRTDAAAMSFADERAPFTPVVNGYIEFRYDLNHTRGGTSTGEDLTTGFSVPRSRMKVTGNNHERLRYEIEAQFSSRTGEFIVLDAYGAFRIAEGTELVVGQFVAPYWREFLLAPANQLGAERSVVNEVFTVGRSQGIMLTRTAEHSRAQLCLSDGAGQQNTSFTSTGEADLAVTGRLEHLGAGRWSQFADFTSFRGSEFAWMAGIAGHWQRGGDTALTNDADLAGVAADLSLEGDGWNAFAALAWQRTGDPTGDFDDFGLLIQGGLFLTGTLEAFARYDAVLADPDRPAGRDFHTLTAGVNWYLVPDSQAAKVTVDLQYFPDPQASSPVGPNTVLGLLGSTEEQVNLRVQISMVF